MENPQYLLIPYQIIKDEKTQPLDALVYGVVYWLEGMRDGECFASNEYIGSIINSNGGSVANSIGRLVESDYLRREIVDERGIQKRRLFTRINFKKGAEVMKGVHPTMKGGSSYDEQNTNTTKNNNTYSSVPAGTSELSYEPDEETTPLHYREVKPLRKWAEEQRGRRFPNPIVQESAIKKLLKTGYTQGELREAWEEMADDEFYSEKGFDFGSMIRFLGKQQKSRKFNPRIHAR